MSYPLRFYAVVIPGLETIAARELESLSAHDLSTDQGGVHFSGTMETMFRINLRSRTITRVLIRIARFTATAFHELEHHIAAIDWTNYLDAESAISVHATSHASRLIHTGKVEEVLVKTLKRQGLGTWPGAHSQSIHIRIDNNRCRVSIDTSGERLDRRGYRLESGKAPVRESLAAAVLQWAGWQADEPLLVPMCGSGTFAIEAAMMAMKKAPGLSHDFPFTNWPGLKRKAWQRVYDKSASMGPDSPQPLAIAASDIHADAVAISRRNAVRAGVENAIEIEQKDAFTLTCPQPDKSGVIVFNPPYGRRIDADIQYLYAELGRLCKNRFGNWRVVIFSPERACEDALGIPVRQRMKVRHGGNWITILLV